MKSSFFTSIMVGLFLICIGMPVFADAPQLLNYQGRLTDTNGDPLNGSYSIQFLIYDDLTAGSTIWSETHSAVNVTEGVYQVLLGSVTPFPQDLFTASIDRYLEIIIAGETLTPRTRFTSVSYALQTSHSDSADVAATAVTAAPTGTAGGDLAGSYPNPTVDGIQGRSVSSTSPTADQVLKWTGSAWAPADDVTGGGSVWQTSGSDIYFNSGNVGIGNISPTSLLDVTGTVTATTFSGSGASLTNLNASNLSSGTVPSARFGGTYSNTVTFSNASNSFTGSGSGLTGLSASNLGTGTLPSGRLNGTYSSALTLSNASNSFTGSGAGLTGLSASNLGTGTLPSGRLSGTYSGLLTLSNASNSFTGSGAGLTSLNGTNISSGTVSNSRLENTIQTSNFYASGTVTASDYMTALGGIHVGGTSDPGTDYLVVDGRIGVGTSSPNLELDIESASTMSGIDINNTGTGDPVIRFQAAGLNKFTMGVDNSDGDKFKLGTAAITTNTIMTIDNTNRIGFGTSTPGYPFHFFSSNWMRGMYIDHNQTLSSTTYGLYVDLDNTNTGNYSTYGIYSVATKTGGTFQTMGIVGIANGTSTGSKYGVQGLASSGSGNKFGVYGYAYGTSLSYPKYGVYGYAGGSSTATKYGLYGLASSTTAGTKYGVYGTASGGTGNRYGVYGLNSPIYGYIGGAARGMEAYFDSGHWGYIGDATRAAYFQGNVQISGTLTKSAGGFKIDHPLDPANKYLIHSFVESPDMKNFYDGVIVLDSNGEGQIELPNWFDEVNIDFRYLLTAIGSPGPNLYISQEIINNQFKIAGGTGGMKVSWQVTGTRNDEYAKANRIKVEEDKVGEERGKYLHPELYGYTEEMRVVSPEKSENSPNIEEPEQILDFEEE